MRTNLFGGAVKESANMLINIARSPCQANSGNVLAEAAYAILILQCEAYGLIIDKLENIYKTINNR